MDSLWAEVYDEGTSLDRFQAEDRRNGGCDPWGSPGSYFFVEEPSDAPEVQPGEDIFAEMEPFTVKAGERTTRERRSTRGCKGSDPVGHRAWSRIMPSPFPGMDPYLEAPDIWPDFHDRLAEQISSELNRTLPPPLLRTPGDAAGDRHCRRGRTAADRPRCDRYQAARTDSEGARHGCRGVGTAPRGFIGLGADADSKRAAASSFRGDPRCLPRPCPRDADRDRQPFEQTARARPARL